MSIENKTRVETASDSPVAHQRLVGRLVEMADRVVADANQRCRALQSGLIFGDSYAVHHEHIYDLEDALKQLKVKSPNDKLCREAGQKDSNEH